MSLSRRVARVEVSNELLCQALGLPDGSEIIAVEADPERPYCTRLMVAHPEFLEVPDGHAAPRKIVIYRQKPDVTSQFEEPAQ